MVEINYARLTMIPSMVFLDEVYSLITEGLDKLEELPISAYKTETPLEKSVINLDNGDSELPYYKAVSTQIPIESPVNREFKSVYDKSSEQDYCIKNEVKVINAKPVLTGVSSSFKVTLSDSIGYLFNTDEYAGKTRVNTYADTNYIENLLSTIVKDSTLKVGYGFKEGGLNTLTTSKNKVILSDTFSDIEEFLIGELTSLNVLSDDSVVTEINEEDPSTKTTTIEPIILKDPTATQKNFIIIVKIYSDTEKQILFYSYLYEPQPVDFVLPPGFLDIEDASKAKGLLINNLSIKNVFKHTITVKNKVDYIENIFEFLGNLEVAFVQEVFEITLIFLLDITGSMLNRISEMLASVRDIIPSLNQELNKTKRGIYQLTVKIVCFTARSFSPDIREELSSEVLRENYGLRLLESEVLKYPSQYTAIKNFIGFIGDVGDASSGLTNSSFEYSIESLYTALVDEYWATVPPVDLEDDLVTRKILFLTITDDRPEYIDWQIWLSWAGGGGGG